jgi:hypothetical protein
VGDDSLFSGGESKQRFHPDKPTGNNPKLNPRDPIWEIMYFFVAIKFVEKSERDQTTNRLAV